MAEPHRGQRHASSLLRERGRYAVERGCRLALVKTPSYQAPPLSVPCGYRGFGELEEIDAGCSFYFLRKNLRPEAP